MKQNQIFRNDYSLEEVAVGLCQLCDGSMTCNAFGRWCSSTCQSCGLLIRHFVKEHTGYRLTDILWNVAPERRFWIGSQNNILFRNSYPRMEFEIENFDRETLLAIDERIKKEETVKAKEQEIKLNKGVFVPGPDVYYMCEHDCGNIACPGGDECWKK